MTDSVEAENIAFRRAAGLVNQAALLALFSHCEKQAEVLATFQALGAQAEADVMERHEDTEHIEMLRKVFSGMAAGFQRRMR
jgi:hypothetical protein